MASLAELSPYVRVAKRGVLRGLSPAFVDPEYVMSYVEKGSETYLLENVKHSVGEGALILMPPYMQHIISTERGLPAVELVIHFDLFAKPERFGPLAKEPGMTLERFRERASDPESLLASLPCAVVSLDQAGRRFVESRFLRVKEEFEGGRELSGLSTKALMLELLRFYLSKLPQEGEGKAARPKVWGKLDKAIKFIHANSRRPLSIREIAKEACISPNYFCALFKEYTDVSPHRYLNALRIDEAQRLMDEGALNFTQIAYETGFPSIHLFSRIFKRRTGLSPTEWLAARKSVS